MIGCAAGKSAAACSLSEGHTHQLVCTEAIATYYLNGTDPATQRTTKTYTSGVLDFPVLRGTCEDKVRRSLGRTTITRLLP